ncbi:MAG: TIGR03560 family F420-dependent LLM class oxidoreductase [Actinomycetota bacterium]|nr:TIGR03560 family F420-dependent LLM class oxidoreductase [Actinomycetota bacterium]
MDFGLDVAQHQLTWPQLVGRVRLAEGTGFAGAWVFDHFKPLYGHPHGPCLEAWTLLAALAAQTEHIRLGVLVTGVTYRHPSVLAAEIVTVDHVSGGRLEVGVGAAWFAEEHRELGIPFPGAQERARRLEEAVEIVRRLLTEDDVRFEGHYHELRGATYRPRPVQRPYPPIWIGATGEQLMLPLAARFADVWHSFGSPAELRRRSRLVDEHAERVGRDPGQIRRASNLSLSQPFGEVRRTIEALDGAGFSYLVVSWPAEGRERLEAFITEILPDYR